MQKNEEGYRRRTSKEMEEEILAKEETIRAFRNAWEAGQEKIVALEKEVHRARKKDLEIERLKQQVEELNEEVRCCHLEMQENRTSMAMWQDKMMENGTQVPLLGDGSWEESPREIARLEEDIAQARTELEWWKNYGMFLASNLQQEELVEEEANVESLVEFVESEPIPFDEIDEFNLHERLERAETDGGVASRASPLSVERLRACVQDALAPRLGAEAAFAHSTTVRAVSPGVFTIGGRRTTCVGLPRTVMVRVGGGWSTLDDALEGMSMPTPSPDEEGSPFGSSLAS
eukprot:jgi/Pico_ML_1/53192/g3787.t2